MVGSSGVWLGGVESQSGGREGGQTEVQILYVCRHVVVLVSRDTLRHVTLRTPPSAYYQFDFVSFFIFSQPDPSKHIHTDWLTPTDRPQSHVTSR